MLLTAIGPPPGDGWRADSGTDLIADCFDPQIWRMVLVGAATIPQLSCAEPHARWPAARRMAVGHPLRAAGSAARHHAAVLAGRPRAQARRMEEPALCITDTSWRLT
jgi:hypothetical protein